MQPHPCAQFAQLARQIGHMRADFFAMPQARLVADVDAVGGGILADHQQFLGARFDQLLRLAQDRIGAAADQIAAQARDDAEGAAVVAAF
ncbi:hypothetical protein D9M73_87510 [compost metagenome]